MSRKNKKVEELERLKHTKATRGRVVKTRNLVVRFLIVCEGSKTEPNYFRALIENRQSNVIEADIEGVGMSTCSLVRRTMEIKKDLEYRQGLLFDRVWVVFDKDSFDDFNEAIDLAHRNRIETAWSNESFELWYYLHFEYLDTAIGRHDYIVRLNNSIRRHKGYENYVYKKNDKGFYALLQDIGNEKNAVDFAIRLRHGYEGQDYKTQNPCTYVDKLVVELRNPMSLLNR